MEPTIRVVTCPCCKSMLFALEMDKADARAGWQITKDSPELKKDGDGHYMKCGTCSKRIALERISGMGMDSWRLAAAQNCNQVLP